ncbi:MAG: ribonuclease HII [Candidatus Hydrogenedentes bacterium]|nr:ribonuclease HII [Candidatus Hydrogenedentota bacterium]
MKALSLAELREQLSRDAHLPAAVLRQLQADPRKGAQQLYAKAVKLRDADKNEASRIGIMLQLERTLEAQGFHAVAGVDEAGRGPLAGPIVAAAVILSRAEPGLNDSKLLTAAQREHLYARLQSGGHAIGVALIAAEQIDRLGIQQANYQVMAAALAALPRVPDFALIDGFSVPGLVVPQQRVVKGDRRSLSIAAASIIAKVTRDRIMCALDEEYPAYGFRHHQGYGTPAHLAALAAHGPCAEHRHSFAPIARQTETGLLFDRE